MQTKFLPIIFLLSVFAIMLFAEVNTTPRADDVVIYSNELIAPNLEQSRNDTITRYGAKSDPGAENIIRWAINAESPGNLMDLSSESAAAGPYGMKFSLNNIPSNNLWCDIRRSDVAIDGWNFPLDVSGTDRATFWIKADAGSAPLFFHAESWKPAELPTDHPKYDANLNNREKSAIIFVDGATVVVENEFGEYRVITDEHYNSEWQYVSIPMSLLMEQDSSVLAALIPWSVVWNNSAHDSEPATAFDPELIRTIKWHTHPENSSVQAAYWASDGNLWSDTPGDNSTVTGSTWEVDEVIFKAANDPQVSGLPLKQVDIWSDQYIAPNLEQSRNDTITRYGAKSDPGSENIIRWAINAEVAGNLMDLSSEAAAEGPYGMKFSLNNIPSNNLWLDVRRSDVAIDGWNYPMDVSNTGRVTFWIKSDPGSAPLFFHAESWKPAELPANHPKFDANLNNREKSAIIFVDGGTVVVENEFGDFRVLQDEHYNGEWQYVSLPMNLLMIQDSSALAELIPWSVVWNNSQHDSEPATAFDPEMLRTIKWHTHPENSSVQAAYWASDGNLWSDTPGDNSTVSGATWYVDEVKFLPAEDQEENPNEISIWRNELIAPNLEQSRNDTITRYGAKSDPGSENIIRWAINAESPGNLMDLNAGSAASGPYGMKFSLNNIPSNNLWCDIRRSDVAIDGWNYPMDVSGTDRVTFWIKAAAGSAPLFFHGESWKPAELPTNHSKYDANLNNREKSAIIFVDGATVVVENEFGDYRVLSDEHYNGEWQFVSIPMSLLMAQDSSALAELIPWSVVWNNSQHDSEAATAFDPEMLRTIKWHTHPENSSVQAAYWASDGNLWSDTPGDNSTVPGSTWEVDEVVFTKANTFDVVSGLEIKETKIPVLFELSNAYPNPFNPTTTLQFKIPVSNNVKVEVFNIMGQKVRTLINGMKSAGTYTLTWDSRNDAGQKVSSGMYFVHMEASHFNATKKAILLK